MLWPRTNLDSSSCDAYLTPSQNKRKTLPNMNLGLDHLGQPISQFQPTFKKKNDVPPCGPKLLRVQNRALRPHSPIGPNPNQTHVNHGLPYSWTFGLPRLLVCPTLGCLCNILEATHHLCTTLVCQASCHPIAKTIATGYRNPLLIITSLLFLQNMSSFGEYFIGICLFSLVWVVFVGVSWKRPEIWVLSFVLKPKRLVGLSLATGIHHLTLKIATFWVLLFSRKPEIRWTVKISISHVGHLIVIDKPWSTPLEWVKQQDRLHKP